MRNYKQFIFYASLIAVFFTIFLLSFTLTSNAYFRSINRINGVITLGKANVMIKNDMPLFNNVKARLNTRLDYPISVVNALDANGKNTFGLIDCILRVKSTLNSGGHTIDFIKPNLEFPNNWVVGRDGYLYYKNIFKVGDSVVVYSNFDVGTTEEIEILEAGINFEIIVETIQAKGGVYKTEWPNAPNLW